MGDLLADLAVIAVPVLTLAILYCLWRAWQLCTRWVPANAMVVKRGSSQADRDCDSTAAMAEALIDPLYALETNEAVDDRVRFVDGEGRERHAFVSRNIGPFSGGGDLVIWYDPRSNDVTAAGPSHWLLWAAIWASVLMGVFYYDGSGCGA